METYMGTITAKPAKLDDGSWGAVTNGSSNVRAGDTIMVKTRNGDTMERVVAEVVDRDHDGGVLVAVKNARTGQEKKGKQNQREQQDQSQLDRIEEKVDKILRRL